jgi:flagellin-like protein
MKGVSALLASVLLIAFTVAIAVIVMNFYSSTIKSSTETIGNKTATATECSSASINVEDVYVSAAAKTASVIVKNTGFTNVVLESAQIMNTTGSNFTTSNVPFVFTKGSIATLMFLNASLSPCPASFSKVYVTTNCGGVADTFEGTPRCS